MQFHKKIRAHAGWVQGVETRPPVFWPAFPGVFCFPGGLTQTLGNFTLTRTLT